MAETATLSWDDDGIGGDEAITESDVKDAESMGRMPWGKWAVTCVESTPKQKDMKAYSCIAANLKFRVDSVIEIKGSTVEGDDGDAYIDRFIFDDVLMYSPQEKDGMRKRRILVAKRIGLISDSSGTITKEMWKTGIIGKRVILTTIEEGYTPKDSDIEKKIVKVDFAGYEAITDATSTAASTPGDDYSDL